MRPLALAGLLAAAAVAYSRLRQPILTWGATNGGGRVDPPW